MKIKITNTIGQTIFLYQKEGNTIKKVLEEAIARNADLRSADLRSADLSRANLMGSDLSRADLSRANLMGADLSDANLSRANLSRANLMGADLSDANLSRANLMGVDLSDANLSGADLSGADLNNVRFSSTTTMCLPQCPEEGSFIGWKAAKGKVVKLLVTEDAQRSSATTLKCRCSKAKVLDIQNIDGTSAELNAVPSNRESDFIYRIGDTVEVENFETNRWLECASGIHFFISRQAAVSWIKME